MVWGQLQCPIVMRLQNSKLQAYLGNVRLLIHLILPVDGVTAEYRATLKQPLKIGGYVILSHYLSAYPLSKYLLNNSHWVSISIYT